jgi:hypothetical protein
MSDSSIIQSMRRSAAAAERQAAQYRRAGRDDDADAAAKDAKRWLQAASVSPRIWAEADRVVAAGVERRVDL